MFGFDLGTWKMTSKVGLLLCLLAVTRINNVQGRNPAGSCTPQLANAFIADLTDPCIYYRCDGSGSGFVVPQGQPCAPGSGTALGGFPPSVAVPCALFNSACQGNNVIAPGPVPVPMPVPVPVPVPNPVPAVPVTAAPQPMTPSPMLPAMNIMLTGFFAGQHIVGGTFRQNGIDLGTCFNLCMMTPDCKAVDYDSRDRSCWTHNTATSCNALVAKSFCTHYRFTNCQAAATTASPTAATGATGATAATPMPSTAAPTSAAPTTGPTSTATPVTASPPTVMAMFNGMHILGGVEVNANTSTQCLALCIGTCQGVDFNSATNGCFHHSAATVCNTLIAKASCTQFRLVTCAATAAPTAAPTPAPTAGPTAAPTTGLPTAAPTPSTTVPNGFVSRNTNMNILGGTLVAVGVNEMQCTDLCLGMFSCLAADYNANDTSCWFHGNNSYCSALSPKVGCTNFRKTPCLTAAGTSNNFVEAIFQFHIFGGTLICTNCTFETCLNMCSANTLCQGADYDSRGGSCYQHTSATVCDPLNSKSFCRHVRKVTCPTTSAMPTTAPGATPFPAPTVGFTTINFAGPSVLPSGWQAYPGNNIAGGDLLATGLTGDACFGSVAANAACLALDFNTGDGSCWCHGTARKCNALTAMNIVYHAKKPPPCTVITGTTTAYPAPVATAP